MDSLLFSASILKEMVGLRLVVYDQIILNLMPATPKLKAGSLFDPL
jgi:hypothetical protein